MRDGKELIHWKFHPVEFQREWILRPMDEKYSEPSFIGGIAHRAE